MYIIGTESSMLRNGFFNKDLQQVRSLHEAFYQQILRCRSKASKVTSEGPDPQGDDFEIPEKSDFQQVASTVL